MNILERKLYAANLVHMADLAQEIATWLGDAHRRAQERDLYLQHGASASVDEICVNLLHASHQMQLLRVEVVREEEEVMPFVPPNSAATSPS
jgi:hypothetical protein